MELRERLDASTGRERRLTSREPKDEVTDSFGDPRVAAVNLEV
jgi:hypothetical protein